MFSIKMRSFFKTNKKLETRERYHFNHINKTKQKRSNLTDDPFVSGPEFAIERIPGPVCLQARNLFETRKGRKDKQ